MDTITNIEIGPILWTIFNFLLLLILLRVFAWKPILSALSNREKTISDALNRAETAQAEADRVLAENKKAMQRAEEDAQRVLRESREYAERMQAEATQKAQDEGRRILDQAKQEIERNKQQALNEMRAEVANLAVGASEKILNETLDPERHKRLVEDYLAQASQGAAVNN
ncbi:MAG: F0F1 ATP synthase subunit B [Bacteroidetes bacterium]|nr:F0F1 ATP synthase subunit B [Bacteroidota bacterium]